MTHFVLGHRYIYLFKKDQVFINSKQCRNKYHIFDTNQTKLSMVSFQNIVVIPVYMFCMNVLTHRPPYLMLLWFARPSVSVISE
jgi:hypothetical protein